MEPRAELRVRDAHTYVAQARLMAALRELGRAILRSRERDALLEVVCSALVESAGYLAASITLPGSDVGVETRANAGEARGPAYLLDLPFREGPAKLAIEGVNPADPAEHASLRELAEDIVYAYDTILREEALRVTATRDASAERERRFSNALIESIPGILYLYDHQGRFLRFNDNFVHVSGYSAEEVAQMHPLDFFAGDEKALLADKIAQVFATGDGFVEATFVSKSGQGTPYFFTGRSIVLDGAPCLVGMGIDMTERRRAEEALARSEARHRNTLDAILEGCQLVDFDYRYLYLNDAASKQNGRPNEELLGRTMTEVWPGIELSYAFSLLKRCLDQRVPVHGQVEFVFPDGRTGWFDLRIQPATEGAYLLSIDITAQRRAEEERNRLLALERSKKDELEQMVQARTAELEAALLRAESADRLKSAFLATMSHELRTPLNSIIGFTGLLLQELPGPLNAEQEKQLGMVRGSARHLLELINDVLDISKIEAGQLELQIAPFDLRESIERVIALVEPMAREQGLRMVTQIGPALRTMTSDRRRVEQILLNLIHNAIKFTDEGSVTLRAEFVRTAEHPAHARIQVIDTGVGIRPEGMAALFQPFRQLDRGVTSRHEGTGLGLAICGRLSALLGGEIAAKSEWGRGSTFSVTLPIDAKAEG